MVRRQTISACSYTLTNFFKSTLRKTNNKMKIASTNKRPSMLQCKNPLCPKVFQSTPRLSCSQTQCRMTEVTISVNSPPRSNKSYTITEYTLSQKMNTTNSKLSMWGSATHVLSTEAASEFHKRRHHPRAGALELASLAHPMGDNSSSISNELVC